MTIADAPLWAQNPTASVFRDLAYDQGNRVSAEPFHVDLIWLHVGDDRWGPVMGVETPGGMTVPEARRLWETLGEVLAIEASDPADAVTETKPLEVDLDGSRSRYKTTRPVSTEVCTRDGLDVAINVELYDNVDQPGQADTVNQPDIEMIDTHANGLVLRSPDDARALAFALFKAAHVADVAIEANS